MPTTVDSRTIWAKPAAGWARRRRSACDLLPGRRRRRRSTTTAATAPVARPRFQVTRPAVRPVGLRGLGVAWLRCGGCRGEGGGAHVALLVEGGATPCRSVTLSTSARRPIRQAVGKILRRRSRGPENGAPSVGRGAASRSRAGGCAYRRCVPSYGNCPPSARCGLDRSRLAQGRRRQRWRPATVPPARPLRLRVPWRRPAADAPSLRAIESGESMNARAITRAAAALAGMSMAVLGLAVPAQAGQWVGRRPRPRRGGVRLQAGLPLEGRPQQRQRRHGPPGGDLPPRHDPDHRHAAQGRHLRRVRALQHPEEDREDRPLLRRDRSVLAREDAHGRHPQPARRAGRLRRRHPEDRRQQDQARPPVALRALPGLGPVERLHAGDLPRATSTTTPSSRATSTSSGPAATRRSTRTPSSSRERIYRAA